MQNPQRTKPTRHSPTGNRQSSDLVRNYLSGTIPPEWGSMEQILTMTVEDNMMSGEIPHELGNLRSIERLFLNSNFFTGELPASFANLTSLKEFRIGSNNFSGRIPDFIVNWTNLTNLRIMASGLEGPIPSGITLLTTLTDLLVISHYISYLIAFPSSICVYLVKRCRRISDLGGPDMPCPSFKNTSFENLILRNCNLIGELPESINSSKLLLVTITFSSYYPCSKTILYNDINLKLGDVYICMTLSFSLYIIFTRKRVSCLGNNVCPRNFTSLYINCGGGRLQIGKNEYESDQTSGGASSFFSVENRWGFSSTGGFMDEGTRDSFIVELPSDFSTNMTELYKKARTSGLSLTYYGICMRSESYNVSLHFAEIIFTNDQTYSSLGRRLFDIYIQGVLREKDFDISEKAGGARKEIVRTYTVNPISRELWPHYFSYFYYPVPKESENGNGVSGGAVAGIVVGAVCGIILILGVLWWCGYLRHRDTTQLELHGLELNTGSFTLRQIKIATNDFDVANKIGEGGFGSVYKGVLPNGTLIAVKQLSSKSKQGNREFLNELGVISALQHPHLVKLYGCCIEGNQLLLAYEYLENYSLARALFGKTIGFSFVHFIMNFFLCWITNISFLYILNPLSRALHLTKHSLIILLNFVGLVDGYMAPEYALRGYLTDKADVYSYGIVLLEIVSGMANIADRAKENKFVLLDRALSLKSTGNLLDLVDPKLGSEYDILEMMVVINLALMCTAITPADRPAMSSVVSMLEGRIVPESFIAEQTISLNEVDRQKMTKQLENQSKNQMEEVSFAYTDSSTSAVDLYLVDRFSEYLQKRESDAKKLLS
ncbi:hypothetical protein E3N88_34625 [Mikania micrantha]|uniref:non-specific serine/threonine protein kinase n=1 Tax=Mikania micrantha TaxID=192012 RepID=A0A5N6LYP0_9ASTR|nr:hypothetical protein E3N88_34625 [Mikania micrantha]